MPIVSFEPIESELRRVSFEPIEESSFRQKAKSYISKPLSDTYGAWKEGWETITKPSPEKEYALTPTDYAKIGLSVAMPFTIPLTRPSEQAVEQTLKSASRMGIGMGEFAGQLVDLTFEPEPYKKAEKTGKILSGLADFMGSPLGLKDIAESLVNEGKLIPEEFKHAKDRWQTDPVGSIMAVLPFVKGGIRTVIDTGKSLKAGLGKRVLFEPLTEELKPTKPSVSGEVQSELTGKGFEPQFPDKPLYSKDIEKPLPDEKTGDLITKMVPEFTEQPKLPISETIKRKVYQTRTPRGFDYETDSLADFVRLEGGISTTEGYMRGEARQYFSIKEGYNLINNKTGKTWDGLAERAWEEGFFDERPTIAEFIDKLKQDVDAKYQKKGGVVFSNKKQFIDEEMHDPRFFETEDVGETYFLDETGNIKTKWDVGNKNPDVNVKIVKQMDISPAEQVLTTLHVADRHPFMKPPIELAIKATQYTNHIITQRHQKLTDIFNKAEGKPMWGLTRRRSSNIRDLDLMIEGKIKVPEQLNELVSDVSVFLEEQRQRVITKKKQDVVSHLSPKQQEYLTYLEEGGNKPKHVRPATIRAVEEVQKQMEEMEGWGKTDYFPRLMKGNYYYLNKDGHILAIGETPNQAKFNLQEKLESNPELKGTIVYFVNGLKDMLNARHTLNPELRGMLEVVGTSLTRKGFFGLINRIEKIVDTEIMKAGAGDVEGIKVDMSGIAKMQSREKFAGNLLKRKTELRGQESDPFKTLSAYTSAVERHLGLSDTKKALIDFEESLPPHMENAKTYVKKLGENMLGHYDWANRFTDQIIGRRIGAKPFLLSRYLQKGQGVMANLKLGFAPVKALLNYIDATFSTLTAVGLKHRTNGLKILHTEKGKALINEIGYLTGMEESFAYSYRVGSQKPNILKPMGLYQFAESKGRSESIVAGYSQGLEIYGGDVVRAKQHATDIARLTQGLYDVAARPVAVRNPLTSTAYQFKQFINNKIRFLSTLTPAQLSFYIPSIISLYGTRGIWLTLKSVIGITLISDLLGNMGEKTNEELNKKYPRLHRGLFGLAGYDVSAPGTIQLPSQIEDWLGPLYNDLFKTGEMVVKGLKNDGWTDEEIAQYINQVAPVGYNIYRGLQLAQTGEIKQGGKLMYRGKPLESIYNFLGGKTVEQSRESDTSIYENKSRKRQNEKFNVIAGKILSSKTMEDLNRNITLAIELKEMMSQEELQNFISGLRKRWMENQLTQRERTFKVLPPNIKRKAYYEEITK